MLKILQASLQQSMNLELPGVQAGFRKGRGTRDQIADIHRIIEQAREFQKNICFTDYAKAFDCVDHNRMWKILKEMGIPFLPPYLPPEKFCMQVKKQQLEPWNNRPVPNGERSTSRLYIVTLLIWLICRIHHAKCQAARSTSGSQDAERNINNLRYRNNSTLMAEIEEELESLDEGETEEWKSWLKTQHSKNQDHGIRSHHFMRKRWGNNGNSDRLYFHHLKMVTAAMKLKDACSLEEKLWPA